MVPEDLADPFPAVAFFGPVWDHPEAVDPSLRLSIHDSVADEADAVDAVDVVAFAVDVACGVADFDFVAEQAPVSFYIAIQTDSMPA